MQTAFFKNWWVIALKGILTIGLGIATLLIPREAIYTWTAILGIAFLAIGLLMIAHTIKNRRAVKHWIISLLEGLIDILFGVYLLINPEWTAYFLTIVAGAWIMFGAVFQGWYTLRHRKAMKNILFPLVYCLCILGLGTAIAFHPLSGIVVLSAILGFTLILLGGLTLVVAWKMRKLHLV